MTSQTDSKVNDENIVFNNFINEDVENENKQTEDSNKEIEDRENFIDSAIKIATESREAAKESEKKSEKKEKGAETAEGNGQAADDIVEAIENAAEAVGAEAEVDVSEPKPKKAKLSDSKKVKTGAAKMINEPSSETTNANKKKRNRKVLSCQKCRKDKQACSRVYPCTRCAKKDFECKFIDNITQEEFFPKADDLPKANPSVSKKEKAEDNKEEAEEKDAEKPADADIEKETAEAVLAASSAFEEPENKEVEGEKDTKEVAKEDGKDQIDADLKEK